jgi:hypothetical protein
LQLAVKEGSDIALNSGNSLQCTDTIKINISVVAFADALGPDRVGFGGASLTVVTDNEAVAVAGVVAGLEALEADAFSAVPVGVGDGDTLVNGSGCAFGAVEEVSFGAVAAAAVIKLTSTTFNTFFTIPERTLRTHTLTRRITPHFIIITRQIRHALNTIKVTTSRANFRRRSTSIITVPG